MTEPEEPPMSRTVLMDVPLAVPAGTERVQARRISMRPGVASGAHVHNCPVVGSIVAGSVVYQVVGEPARVLGPGDVFVEPAGVPVARFDAQDDGAVFLAYFLLRDGEEPAISGVDG